MIKYFTSESVTEGHPDKLCDQISDALLDAFLQQDKKSRVAVETFALTGQVVVGGEVTTKGWVNAPDVVREVIKNIGYVKTNMGFNYDCGIMTAINSQSPDIAMGVDTGGAGDQGMMFGGAVRETEELMPLPIEVAHFITKWLTQQRKSGAYDWMLPDGKSQVTVPYVNGRPVYDEQWSIVVSTQHVAEITVEEIKKILLPDLFTALMLEFGIPPRTLKEAVIHINPTGKFVIGGPHGDSGLTGRKIIVDTYGGYFRHGGGAFSGKDPSKVDRSATYMARHLAKSIVGSELAHMAEVQLSYAIGVKEPVSVLVDTNHTGQIPDDVLADLLRKNFDLTPLGIIEYLGLLDTTYQDVAAYDHFDTNAKDKSWEKIYQLK